MNSFESTTDRPVGAPVSGWSGCSVPPHRTLKGRYCELHPLSVERHGRALYEAFGRDAGGKNWTYLPVEPFEDYSEFEHWFRGCADSEDPQFYAVVDASTGRALGMASYLRPDPANGVIEVGHIHFSPLLQRTPMGTEAMYLMMGRVFDQLGYRRYEWKCDALNEASRKAAARLGFQFEGIFRQALVYKGRNRDTAWFSVIDRDWPSLKSAFEQWLHPDNFDQQGNQISSLGMFRY